MSISVDMMIESTCQHTPTFAGILCHSKHKGGKVKKPGLVVSGRHDNIRSKYGVRLMFTIRDIIDLAIQIEQNGEKVYRKAAREISNSSISSLLLWLAGEEVKHAKWFSELKEIVNETVEDPRIEETGKRILQGVLGDQSFSLRDVDFSTMKETADLLKAAIEFQEDTCAGGSALACQEGWPDLCFPPFQ